MFGQFAAPQLFKRLEQLEQGRLHLTTPDGKVRVFEGRQPGAAAALEMRDWRVLTNLAAKGDVGFADDYRKGLWETDNLKSLIELGLQNTKAFERFVLGGQWMRKLTNLSYMLRLNTLKGSRKNIHAHYDLGNEFYKLWLDPSMTYSSALFTGPDQDLTQAQYNKYDRMTDRLNSQSGSLLEIGCGWGGFAERALTKGDFDIKGITVSKAQHDFAQQRLGTNANIALEDYRHQTGKFDHIISIEMFEAVGEQYWQTYFQKLSSLLKSGGRAVVQTITMRERDFPRYRTGSDFIRSFIFPGGMLPSPSRFREEAAKAGLRVQDEFHFGKDYARTLDIWLHNFDAQKPAVKAMGFDDGFIRLWRFYLAACIAGFNTGRTSVMQVEMSHV
jgi:cyclopropane-fatty-acyl-phospholipid synthase